MANSHPKNKIGLELKLVDAIPGYGIYKAAIRNENVNPIPLNQINIPQMIAFSVYQIGSSALLLNLLYDYLTF